MPWKAICAMEQRFQFVMRCRDEATSMAELCRQFGISRETGYKWQARFAEGGVEALTERSRARARHPNATPETTLQLIRELRGKHPTYGPKKLVVLGDTLHPDVAFPAASTVGAFLHREGLVVPRRRVRHARVDHDAPAHGVASNHTWVTDFKGQFRVGNGTECYPLTIGDEATRFLIRCHALRHPRFELALPVFDAAFREYGLPTRLRSDNGSPFASASFSGLTRLSAWWVKHGIIIERSRPGCPQDNGRLERFHRTLKAETTRPPAATFASQQRTFVSFRRQYNEERPHEAIGQRTPAALYEPSVRRMPHRTPTPIYEARLTTRKLAPNGVTRWRGFELTVSRALGGERIALEEIDEGVWSIRFYAMHLGIFDERTGLLTGPTYKRRLLKRAG